MIVTYIMLMLATDEGMIYVKLEDLKRSPEFDMESHDLLNNV